ncbi:MAG: 2Fe-2S iron-sulfur cluster-binding protein [Rhodobacteraceae bacterium]|nr:2Fe-2S iron-sulfur cluster-binding protein [Paracoccaceae bacterium]
MAPAFHELEIAETRHETSGCVVLTFNLPTCLGSEFQFAPGQHVSLSAEIGGKDVRRTYSICSLPGEKLAVAVRLQPKGLFSQFVRTLRPGMKLAVMTPSGRFTWSDERNALLLAAGSGITPILSIAGHLLATGGRATLLYGNRSARTTMFLDQLAMLKDRHLSRFSIVHVMSREDGFPPLLRGRIDGNRVRHLAESGVIAVDECDGVFICGPGEMLQDTSRAMREWCADEELIHIERYAPVPARYRGQAQPQSEDNRAGPEINILLDGRRRVFRYHSSDGSVIAAALRNGHELPFSCRGGMCGTCRCRIVEGRAEMQVNYALQPWEVEAGFTLACQTQPLGESLTLDFDAV